MVAGDFNEDNNEDLAIISRVNDNIEILLGDGTVVGEFSGNEFFLNKKQDIREFIEKLQSELKTLR